MKTKTKTKITMLTAVVAALFTIEAGAKNLPRTDGAKQEKNRVQLALLLDTSNSMDGLIDQAKTQLWKVVNSFIDARRDGEAPFVEVALYEYGNNDQAVGNHYIRLVQPLSRDLDEISQQLFALETNGGEEYCGAVIQRALADLQWDERPETYKAVFIAGNEAFTQGPVEPQSVCRESISKNVIINTIHCGSRSAGVQGSWHDGAAIGGGEFMVIDQDRAVAHIPAPQDARISELGEKLNRTYIAYGKGAQGGILKQQRADQFAAANEKAGSAVQRSISKASQNYHNANWDLVDALREEKIDLAKIDSKDLPEDLREFDAGRLRQHVETAAKKRAEIQSEIHELDKQREAYVAAEREKLARDGAKTLDQVLVETTRKQAKKLGYTYGE